MDELCDLMEGNHVWCPDNNVENLRKQYSKTTQLLTRRGSKTEIEDHGYKVKQFYRYTFHMIGDQAVMDEDPYLFSILQACMDEKDPFQILLKSHEVDKHILKVYLYQGDLVDDDEFAI